MKNIQIVFMVTLWTRVLVSLFTMKCLCVILLGCIIISLRKIQFSRLKLYTIKWDAVSLLHDLIKFKLLVYYWPYCTNVLSIDMVKAFIARTPAIWRMWLYALLLVIQNAPDGIPFYINFVFLINSWKAVPCLYTIEILSKP